MKIIIINTIHPTNTKTETEIENVDKREQKEKEKRKLEIGKAPFFVLFLFCALSA